MIIIFVLIFIFITCYYSRENYKNIFIFDDKIYGYKIPCVKLCEKFTLIMNKFNIPQHNNRNCKKIISIGFRSPKHYNDFINAINGKGKFNDRICLEYSFSPKEKSSISYHFTITKKSIKIFTSTFEENCVFY